MWAFARVSFTDESLSVRITVPDAELESLSFCDPDPVALSDWVGGLPMANTSDTATQIRQATFEICRLVIDFPQRMELLEGLRPSLHYLCARLDRSATNTSTHGDSIARLAQRLQTNLSCGYKAVILAGLQEAPDRGSTDKISLAIHRAISDISRTLLRTLQFYVAPADCMWLELNQLYLLAERLSVQDERWEDSENHSNPLTSIKDAYLRSILLALSKPNQMRHRQLSHVFNALETWSTTISLDTPDETALFCVDLESDQGPGDPHSGTGCQKTRWADGVRESVSAARAATDRTAGNVADSAIVISLRQEISHIQTRRANHRTAHTRICIRPEEHALSCLTLALWTL